ncbi:hypothetical protein QJQ45_016909 [Haematococcus lacustris]|nr:hypothetical protein QJQ45_016909 [Haematococcus lacustris]
MRAWRCFAAGLQRCQSSHAGERSVHYWRGGGYLGTGRDPASAADPRFLVTGACGQIGAELIPFLRARVGVENVISSDVKTNRTMLESGPFVYLDVLDKDNLARVTIEHGITHIIHLATLLSGEGQGGGGQQAAIGGNATGDKASALAAEAPAAAEAQLQLTPPLLLLRLRLRLTPAAAAAAAAVVMACSGIQNVLDLAAQHSLKVYSPSTIAVFGSNTPKDNTPNDTIMRPSTMYGVTKVHSELLGHYYRDKFGVDFRSLRYPGIISANSPPGGGTTDYAVDIFHHALRSGHYTCFLEPDVELPMMYMPDCLSATWKLMMAPRERLTHTTYNVAAVSFSPAQLAAAIRTLLPHFTITYTPDYRNEIAKTWPRSLDDSLARVDWGWQPHYDLLAMTRHMLLALQHQASTSTSTSPPLTPSPSASSTYTTAPATPSPGLSSGAGGYAEHLMPEATQENWAAGLSDARSVTTGHNGAQRPMRLVIWHECQSLGCAATYDCELCRHNPARRCTEHFRAKYLIRDSARAKCGGAVRVRVEVAGCDAETSTSPNLPWGTQVEVIVLKGGAEYEHLARGVGSPQPGLEEILSLAVHYDRALIRRDDSSDVPHRITVALEKNEYGNVLGCSLADLHFTTSSEVLLGGKAPLIRLLLLAVDRLGMPLPNVEYAVSEPFTEQVRRARQTAAGQKANM